MNAPCCVCPPDCANNPDVHATADCAFCLNGCPAGDGPDCCGWHVVPCARDCGGVIPVPRSCERAWHHVCPVVA